MSAHSTATTGRSLLGEALHWALPRLAIYVLAAVGAVVAFTVWAVIYTYVWPGKPPIEPSAPTAPLNILPPVQASPPNIADPAAFSEPLVSQVPSDALPIEQLRKLAVYDLTNAKIGRIEDVLVGTDPKNVVFIVGVDHSYSSFGGKNIAVPYQAVQFKKVGDVTWISVLHMTKADVQKAPKQIFDPAVMTWVPESAR